jgi:hypothetical protein
MKTSIHHRFELCVPIASVAVVAVMAVGCDSDSAPNAESTTSTVASLKPASTPVSTGGGPTAPPTAGWDDTTQIQLKVGRSTVTATLVDTPAAHDLLRMSPLSLRLTDTFGQAKSGHLPRPLRVDGAPTVRAASPGGLYYWAPNKTFAVYYDDLGQTVPPPGLVRLGTIDSNLRALAEAGNHPTITLAGVD